jgi:ankyrin repeat protein
VYRETFEAINYGDVNTAKILFNCINHSCTLDAFIYYTPQSYADNKGHVDLVRVFLEGGANVEISYPVIVTAVHYAASGGHLDVCRVLLDGGVNMDPVKRWKITPLHLAAQNGHLLVERGADDRLKDEDGQTGERKIKMSQIGWAWCVVSTKNTAVHTWRV